MKYKPFIRWVGGKTRNLKVLDPLLPDMKGIKVYHEPFLGGGAMFFNILNKGLKLDYRLSDINRELMNLWDFYLNDLGGIKEGYSELAYNYNLVSVVSDENRKAYYYSIRDEFNNSKVEDALNHRYRSIRMLFLLKTCFNGIWRENSNGGMNAPVGDKRSIPLKLEPINIKQKIKFYDRSYNDKTEVPSRSFYFMDPPFYVGDESKFTAYNKDGFGVVQQMELAVHFRKLSEQGAKIMLCNSANGDGFLESLYKGFDIQYYDVNRGITGGKGGKNREMVVRNYV